eukprot:TRINITY_DN33_c2_g1_i14.p1 TRINITY_DN33_c2_g1~~TRINITY_DN33_c2_g1_i14.p1  ORF type:complete len:391 (+),score=67.60 TRINITY_DN33_c2_g1_i14:1459-2631(+)
MRFVAVWPPKEHRGDHSRAMFIVTQLQVEVRHVQGLLHVVHHRAHDRGSDHHRRRAAAAGDDLGEGRHAHRARGHNHLRRRAPRRLPHAHRPQRHPHRHRRCRTVHLRSTRPLTPKPRDAICGGQRAASEQWRALGFVDEPDYAEAARECAALVACLQAHGVEVLQLPPAPDLTNMDSLYVYDPVFMTSSGAIILRMGKEKRRGEPAALKQFLVDNKVPILGEITGDGTLEGGDICWLDSKTVAVGLTYRSNIEGVSQVTKILSGVGISVFPVQLPHYKGSADLLHLLSCISILAPHVAIVHKPLLPVCFLQEMQRRGFKLIDCPPEEFGTSGCNVEALSPSKCLLLQNNVRTQQVLAQNGFDVHTFKGDELCIKGCAGPTCTIQPLLRT